MKWEMGESLKVTNVVKEIQEHQQNGKSNV
jgi:hypothetical protein